MNRRRPDDSPDRNRRGARGRESPSGRRDPPAERSAERAGRASPADSADAASTSRTGRYAGAGAGVVAALFVAPIVTTPADAVAAGAGNLLALVALVACVVWAFRRLRSPDRPIRWSAVDLPVLALAVWIGLSGWWNAADGAPRPTLNACWIWIGLVASYWLARQWLRSAADCRAIAAVLFALTVAESTYGVYQSVYAMPQARAAFQRNPDAALREIGVSAPPGSPQRAQYAARIASTEPVGTFSLTNSLAGLLVPWLLAAAGVVAAARLSPAPLDAAPPVDAPDSSPDEFGRRARYALLAALAVAAFCLLLTKSRAGYGATAAGVGLIGLQTLRSRRRIPWRWCAAAGVGIGLAVGGAALAGLVDRQVLTEARKSLGYRWEYWTATSALIADRPLFGCGPGNFQSYYAGYKAPESSETVADPHNGAFEAAATAGLPAAFCLFLFVGLLGVRLVRSAIPGEPPGAADGSLDADAPRPVPPTAGSGDRSAHDSADDSLHDASSDSRRWIYGGAAGGVVLGAVASLLGQFAPDPFFVLVALPVGCLLVGLLDGWVRRGRLPAWTIGVALLGLLLNLQVAGALTFPGVIGSFWLLAAIGVRLTESRGERRFDARKTAAEAPEGAVSGAEAAAGGRAVRLAALAIGLGLVVACVVTGYRPVLLAQIELDLGDQYLKQGRFDAADEAYRAAAERDRWSYEPPLRQAHSAARRLTTGDASTFWFDRLDAATDSALQLNARAYVVRRELGDVHLAVWRSTGEPRALAQAERMYAEATRLYPHSNILHAQLAWTLHLAGEAAGARAAASEALRLDALCPHREQQLKNQSLYDAPEARPSGRPGPPTEDAERTMHRLTGGEPGPQTGERSVFPPRALAVVPSGAANYKATVVSTWKANRPCARS